METERSLCTLIMGRAETPAVLIETAKLSYTIMTTVPPFGDGYTRGGHMLLLHPGIRANEAEWQKLADLCRMNLIAIKAPPEEQLLSISPAQTIGFAFPHMVDDVILILPGDTTNCSVGKLSAREIWQIVESFYQDSSLHMVVGKVRDYAFVRSLALRFDITFAASCCAARRTSVFAYVRSLVTAQRPGLWPLRAVALSGGIDEVGNGFGGLVDEFHGIYQAAVSEVRQRRHFVLAPFGWYEIQIKVPEEFLCQDMIGMMEMEANLRGGTTRIAPR